MQSGETVYLDSTLCDSLRALMSSENNLDDLVKGVLEAYVERRSNEDEIIAKYISVTPVVGHLDNLEEDGTYKIIVTAKFPADGTLQINMGSWSANDQATFPVTATGDFQDVECLFEGWSVNAEGAHLLFQCGDFLGTTIVKHIKVIQIGGEGTGIEAVKADQKFNGAIYNLAGQKVNANYKGVVIQNGKKFIQK